MRLLEDEAEFIDFSGPAVFVTEDHEIIQTDASIGHRKPEGSERFVGSESQSAKLRKTSDLTPSGHPPVHGSSSARCPVVWRVCSRRGQSSPCALSQGGSLSCWAARRQCPRAGSSHGPIVSDSADSRAVLLERGIELARGSPFEIDPLSFILLGLCIASFALRRDSRFDSTAT